MILEFINNLLILIYEYHFNLSLLMILIIKNNLYLN